MNLLKLAPDWLLILLCVLLVIAAVEDAMRLRISNILVVAVAAGAIAAMALTPFSISVWQNVVFAIVLLAGGTLLFATGNVGGGDVKLFAAVGLWADFERAIVLLAAIFISGGLLALGVILSRLLFKREKISASKRSKSVPYAVAIAIGALIVIAIQYRTAVREDPRSFHALPAVPAAARL
ncbi:MAG TPA: prepilin peptidase [Sphingomicrobium sp.]|nr:prepilin peptidase [Sphingomicrobium sp.]